MDAVGLLQRPWMFLGAFTVKPTRVQAIVLMKSKNMVLELMLFYY
jgi:hypothetical protein